MGGNNVFTGSGALSLHGGAMFDSDLRTIQGALASALLVALAGDFDVSCYVANPTLRCVKQPMAAFVENCREVHFGASEGGAGAISATQGVDLSPRALPS